jgi:hypothetical protein
MIDPRIRIGVVIAIVAALALGAGIQFVVSLSYSPKPGTVITIPGTTINLSATTTFDYFVCSTQGPLCADYVVDSLSLTGSHPPNSSMLFLTITDKGNAPLTSLTITIQNQTAAQEAGIPIGQTSNFVVQIPQTIAIVSGQSYVVTVEAMVGGTPVDTPITVTAK